MSGFERVTILHNTHKPEEPVQQLAQHWSDARVVPTASLEQGVAAAREAVEGGADLLVAAGGDGTLLSAVHVAAGTSCAVGVLPLGTANDLAHHLGLNDLSTAMDALGRGNTRLVDTFEIAVQTDDGERVWRGCTTAGAGLFADVVAQEFTDSGQRLLRWVGPAAWLWFTVRLGLLGKPVPGRLTLDGEVHELDMLTLDLFKVRAMGGFTVVPDASLDSGVLHGWTGTLASRPRRVQALLAGLRTSGGHLTLSDVVAWGTPERPGVQALTLETTPPVTVHVHGEIAGTTPLRSRLLPATLRIVCG